MLYNISPYIFQGLENKTILITGGTGSFGNKLIDIIVSNCTPEKIIVFSRDEYKQFIMKKRLTNNSDKYSIVDFVIGDIRDYDRVLYAFKDVDIVFHAAALKHVPIIENNPSEAIKTNITGTENIIKAAIVQNVSKVIALSTDKCVAPINLYGATKLCVEKLIIAGNLQSSTTVLSVVRYGNVLGSRGSVVPIFFKQRDSGELTLTDTRMTRFTITLEDAVAFTLDSLHSMIGGEVFIPKLPSYNILQLANIIAPNANKKIVGIRAGEKIHEAMLSEFESHLVLDTKTKYVLLPTIKVREFEEYRKLYGNKKCDSGFSYTSSNNILIGDNKLSELISCIV